ncbi:QsdR family transcriptional regulator [Geodermatophilus sp. SYSU D01106]
MTAAADAGTRLRRALSGTGDDEGPVRAFRLARRTFLSGERVDMGPLAAELGVDRATLFRWVGNRDQLLTEVIWSLFLPTWRRALDDATGTGGPRVVDALTRFTRDVCASAPFRAHLRREPERALRLLTTRSADYQVRVTGAFAALLQDSGAALPLPVPDTAYVLTRVAESFIYADLIAGAEPDAAKAAVVYAALLRCPAPHPGEPHPGEPPTGEPPTQEEP